jgi:hypothetical protein
MLVDHLSIYLARCSWMVAAAWDMVCADQVAGMRHENYWGTRGVPALLQTSNTIHNASINIFNFYKI